MGHKYSELMFTDQVKTVQIENSSREHYARFEGGEDANHLLGGQEREFIQARDSFYMASINENSWPYVQHRGGPQGFLKVIDSETLAFADFRGNRQYISTGNFRTNDKVALFFMDYVNRTRLKVLGRISVIPANDIEILAMIEDPNYRARVEKGFRIQIEAFDWNCPQHITQRYTTPEVEQLVQGLADENQKLKEHIKLLQS